MIHTSDLYILHVTSSLGQVFDQSELLADSSSSPAGTKRSGRSAAKTLSTTCPSSATSSACWWSSASSLLASSSPSTSLETCWVRQPLLRSHSQSQPSVVCVLIYEQTESLLLAAAGFTVSNFFLYKFTPEMYKHENVIKTLIFCRTVTKFVLLTPAKLS